MKPKIVIKVQMTSDRHRTKAMKIAATIQGVNSVAIDGPDKDRLVVTGEGVDSVTLTCSLRKKLCSATIIKVEEVKKIDEKKLLELCCSRFPACQQYPPCYTYYQAAPDPCPGGCSLM